MVFHWAVKVQDGNERVELDPLWDFFFSFSHFLLQTDYFLAEKVKPTAGCLMKHLNWAKTDSTMFLEWILVLAATLASQTYVKALLWTRWETLSSADTMFLWTRRHLYRSAISFKSRMTKSGRAKKFSAKSVLIGAGTILTVAAVLSPAFSFSIEFISETSWTVLKNTLYFGLLSCTLCSVLRSKSEKSFRSLFCLFRSLPRSLQKR